MEVCGGEQKKNLESLGKGYCVGGSGEIKRWYHSQGIQFWWRKTGQLKEGFYNLLFTDLMVNLSFMFHKIFGKLYKNKALGVRIVSC